ncbi:MAG: hypothetical protein NVS2B16_07440 [Chloroflexota bacterium]
MPDNDPYGTADQEQAISVASPDTGHSLMAPDYRPGLPMSSQSTDREEGTSVQRFSCPDCGTKNVMTAQHCETCGVSFYVDLESHPVAPRVVPEKDSEKSGDYPEAGIVVPIPDFRPGLPLPSWHTHRDDVPVVDGFRCPDCDEKNDWDAQYCEACGVSFYIHLASRHDMAPVPTPALE